MVEQRVSIGGNATTQFLFSRSKRTNKNMIMCGYNTYFFLFFFSFLQMQIMDSINLWQYRTIRDARAFKDLKVGFLCL